MIPLEGEAGKFALIPGRNRVGDIYFRRRGALFAVGRHADGEISLALEVVHQVLTAALDGNRVQRALAHHRQQVALPGRGYARAANPHAHQGPGVHAHHQLFCILRGVVNPFFDGDVCLKAVALLKKSVNAEQPLVQVRGGQMRAHVPSGRLPQPRRRINRLPFELNPREYCRRPGGD